MRTNLIQEKWDRGESVLNGWLSIPNSFSAEIMAHQGYDSLTIDMQHGPIDEAHMVKMLQAISTTHTVPVVRVPWLEPGIIMKALDMGAVGVICPMVNTREEAERFVAYTTYAPKGCRSFGPIRAALYGGPDYFENADHSITRFAMIETHQALDNLDAILAVEGLDAIYVGPSDLSISLGCKPVFDDVEPKVADAIAYIAERCAVHGVKAGAHNFASEGAKRRLKIGYNFVTVGSDARLMTLGSQAIVQEMQDSLGPAKG